MPRRRRQGSAPSDILDRLLGRAAQPLQSPRPPSPASERPSSKGCARPRSRRLPRGGPGGRRRSPALPRKARGGRGARPPRYRCCQRAEGAGPAATATQGREGVVEEGAPAASATPALPPLGASLPLSRLQRTTSAAAALLLPARPSPPPPPPAAQRASRSAPSGPSTPCVDLEPPCPESGPGSGSLVRLRSALGNPVVSLRPLTAVGGPGSPPPPPPPPRPGRGSAPQRH